MSKLELKVPPVVVMLVAAGLMWLAARYFPLFEPPASDQPTVEQSNSIDIHQLAAKILLALGVLIAIISLVSFARAKTTVDPTNPDAASSLITSGLYRFTRNPIYLAMLFILLAWGVKLGNVLSLVLTTLFVLYMTRFQIVPEERALEAKFGEAFRTYKKRVRRWL